MNSRKEKKKAKPEKIEKRMKMLFFCRLLFCIANYYRFFFLNQIVFSLQHPPVTFSVDELEPALTYRVILFAVNAKGRSEPTILDNITMNVPSKFTGELNFLLHFLLRVFFVVVVVSFILGFFYRSHYHHYHYCYCWSCLYYCVRQQSASIIIF